MAPIVVSAEWVAEVQRERAEWAVLLRASYHALRSYQYGNAATDPAKDLADAIADSSAWRVIAELGPKPPASAKP
jgi:hypothetical protein